MPRHIMFIFSVKLYASDLLYLTFKPILPVGNVFSASNSFLSKLDWETRLKIALDAAKGLEYLHEHVNPPVIHRDFKSSNILLDKNFHAKVSDFGLAKLGPEKAGGHVSTRVLGTQGYVAPE